MLPGLADIDWSSMHHAYGTAEEVPELLEQLASPDADVRDKALSRFYSAAHHQGEVDELHGGQSGDLGCRGVWMVDRGNTRYPAGRLAA